MKVQASLEVHSSACGVHLQLPLVVQDLPKMDTFTLLSLPTDRLARSDPLSDVPSSNSLDTVRGLRAECTSPLLRLWHQESLIGVPAAGNGSCLLWVEHAGLFHNTKPRQERLCSSLLCFALLYVRSACSNKHQSALHPVMPHVRLCW